MLAAGKLKDKIVIYSPLNSQSASGALVEKIQFARKLWAAASKTSHSSAAEQDQRTTKDSYQFCIRYSTKYTLAAGDWLQYRGRFMRITAVDDSDPKRQQIVLSAEYDHKSAPKISVESLPADDPGLECLAQFISETDLDDYYV